jgi:RND family efflux transporter MFP subunit
MKKIIYPVALLLTLGTFSCSDKTDIEKLTTEKDDLQTEIDELQVKLDEVNLELDALDTTEVDNRVPVGVQTLTKKSFTSYLEVNGVVESNETVNVMPELSATISRITVKEGQKVKKGQTIAYLDTELIDQQIRELYTALDLAESIYQKQKLLQEKNVGTEVQFLEAKNRKESLEQQIVTAKTQKSKAVIKSPVSGKIDEIYPHTGEMATPGNAFARVVNTSNVYVSADISEAYFYKINSGDKVKLRTLNGGLGLIESELVYKGNFINPGNRTFKVHAELPKGKEFPPNMLMGVQVIDNHRDSVFTVPRLIVQSDSKGTFIYQVITQNVEKDGGKLETKVASKLRVSVKESYNGATVVEGSNIEEGTQIIVNNYKGVDSGSELKLVKK